MVGGPAKLSEKGSLVCKHSNEGEPSDDQSKIRGEILSSGDPFTLPRTDTCTECSYGKVDSWVWNLGVAPINPFFLVHSGGCGHTCADYR